MVTAVVALQSVVSPAPRSTWQAVFDKAAMPPAAEYYLERLPVTAVDHALRTGVKKLINFKD
jgi:hypothetical protein